VANRRGDVSDADAGVVRAQFARETGAISWVRLDASGRTGATAHAALELLGAESR
jgi:predicted kinase